MPASGERRRPHVVIFNPDQWRWDVMGHLGNPAAVTPHLDRFAGRDAVSFRNAFVQNTVCTPSRCSFMTGWYPHTMGHRTMAHMLHDHEPCLLKVLREQGYFVFWSGKNDLAPGQDGWRGFADVYFQPTDADFARWGLRPQESWHGNADGWRGPRDGDNFYSFHRGRLDTAGQSVYGDSDWFWLNGAIDFVRGYDGDKPLCLYLPLVYPHPPYAVEDPWFSMIDRSALPPRIPAPDDWDAAGKPSLLKGIAQLQNLAGWTEDRWTELRAVYYGQCARVDHQFGLLMQALRDRGMYDDAAVFFFSDHGDFTGDYGLVEKTQNTFEDVLSRVPLLIKPPAGVPCRPHVTDAMAELVDFSETVYDLLGIDPPYTRFGRSLRDVLAGATDEHRDAVFCEGGRLMSEQHTREAESGRDGEGLYWPRLHWQHGDGPEHGKAAMCRTRTHKYVRRLCERDELYDLRSDPHEQHNLIDEPALVAVLADLRDRMLTWYQQTADQVPHQLDRRGF